MYKVLKTLLFILIFCGQQHEKLTLKKLCKTVEKRSFVANITLSQNYVMNPRLQKRKLNSPTEKLNKKSLKDANY